MILVNKFMKKSNTLKYCKEVERKMKEQYLNLRNVIIREKGSPLVSLKKSNQEFVFEPSINLNYSYLVRLEVFQKLENISKKLKTQDKVLVIKSVWRSVKHQKILWSNKIKELRKKHPGRHLEDIEKMASIFVASPKESMHLTGGSVDALIYDLKKEKIIDFGTNKGYKIILNKKCYPFHPGITLEEKKNRKLLISLFESEDFVCDLTEYWHFNYGNTAWALEKNKKCAIYGPVENPDQLKM